MEHYYQDCLHGQELKALPKFVPFTFGNPDLMSNSPADADNKPGCESLCLLGQENDAFAAIETGCPVRVSCSGLTLDEERRFSRNIRKFFGAACLLIQRKVFKKQNFAALQEEIGSWEPGGSSPVPQKRRVHRIRVEIADRAAQDDSFSRKLQRHVLALLDKVDRAAEELILGNMGLVHIIASQFHGKGVGREDLIQEGNIGLMKTAYRFDCSKACFSTYASFWIRQSMGKAVMMQSRTIRLPCHLYEQKRRFFKCYFQMRNEYGRPPEDKEVSLRSGVPMRIVQKIKTTPPATSLDAPVSENVDLCLGNLIADKTQDTPDKIFQGKEVRQVIKQIFTELKAKEVEVLKMRFGIAKSRSYTLREIGKKFGVTRERVRQIEKIAMARLRHPVRRHMLDSLR